MYGGGWIVDRRISVGESSEEWLMLVSTVGTVELVNWNREDGIVCCIMGVSKADWGGGRWIVEVYKWSPGRSH